jgi:hypothetical protein
MMLIIVMALVYVGITFNVQRSAPEQPRENIVVELKSETVALVFNTGDALMPYCGGVWIADDKIITADHCARAVIEILTLLDASDPWERKLIQSAEDGFTIHYATDLTITPDGTFIGEEHKSMIIGFEYESDLALLIVLDPPKHGTAKLATKVEPGENVHLMGHPGLETWSYGTGYVSAIRQHHQLRAGYQGPFIHIGSAAWKGSSGSGVFNDSRELIGIVSFLSEAPGNAMLIHVNSIRDFLARVEERQLSQTERKDEP